MIISVMVTLYNISLDINLMLSKFVLPGTKFGLDTNQLYVEEYYRKIENYTYILTIIIYKIINNK